MMSDRTGSWISAEVVAYAQGHAQDSTDEVLAWITAQSRSLGSVASMQIGSDQVAFMTILAKILHVRSAVEVGTFTGSSSLAIARGLAPGGRLLCCDMSEEWTAIAREAWARAGVSDKIDLRLAPALDTLRSLPDDPTIDLAFVDADKSNYQRYIDEIIPRLRPGGVLLIDNTIWSGRVVQPTAPDDHDTAAIKAVNDALAADTRVDSVLLTLGDGLSMARKR